MGVLKKLKLKINKFWIILLLTFTISQITYAGWYEEPAVYETEKIDDMWWLSKSKREKLRQEQQENLEKKKVENKNKSIEEKKIKWLYDDLDITSFPKNKWETIDDNNDGIAYKYYFDKDGYLLIDTLTPDYKIVDKSGREVDYNFRTIRYSIDGVKKDEGIVTEESDVYRVPAREQAHILIGEGVNLKSKKKIYDTTINKNVLEYVDKSERFLKNTKGIIFNQTRWKDCSSLKGNGGYVTFTNPKNNFNKITGYITTEYFSDIDDNADCILRVYDADLYDKLDENHMLHEIEEVYQNSDFYKSTPVRFSFVFNRSIKRLRFEVESTEGSKSLTCFMKDLKYGFSKEAFYNELIRKKKDEEEIEELKRLGIYIEDSWSLEALDENGNIIEEEEENDNENDGNSHISDEETKPYEDVVRDRSTGPAFDETLQNGTTWRNSGPAFINIGTSSNIK